MNSNWRALTVLLVAALLLSVAQPALAQEGMERTGLRPDAPEYAVRGPHWVGYKPLIIGEGTNHEMEVDLWYPALNPEGMEEKVAYEFTLNTPDWHPDGPTVTYGRALSDAPIDDRAGPYPLVVFSHGFSVNPEWYPTLPEHYASHGFIVLAPEHVEQFDWGFSQVPAATIDRPLDIKQTLDYAEEMTAPAGDLAGQIDMHNIAVVGHSYGGYTALAMAGAQYDFKAFTERCQSVAEDDPDMYPSTCVRLIGKEDFLAERAGLKEVPEGLWPAMGDPRVTAIIPIAGDSYQFGEAGLAKITVPMMVIGGTADTMTPYDWGSKPSYDYASSEKKALVALEGAEHTFAMGFDEDMPWITATPFGVYACYDPVWDRARSLDLVHHFSTAFLLDVLKGDAEAAAALIPDAVDFPGIQYQATYTTAEANQAVVRRNFEELWSQGDLDVADEIVVSDFVLHDPFGVVNGPAGYKQMVAVYRAAYPDLNIGIEEMIIAGNKVIVRWTATGTHRGDLMGIPPTGIQTTTTGTTIWQLQNGQIVEAWQDWNALGMLQQLGAELVPPGSGD